MKKPWSWTPYQKHQFNKDISWLPILGERVFAFLRPISPKLLCSHIFLDRDSLHVCLQGYVHHCWVSSSPSSPPPSGVVSLWAPIKPSLTPKQTCSRPLRYMLGLRLPGAGASLASGSDKTAWEDPDKGSWGFNHVKKFLLTINHQGTRTIDTRKWEIELFPSGPSQTKMIWKWSLRDVLKLL